MGFPVTSNVISGKPAGLSSGYASFFSRGSITSSEHAVDVSRLSTNIPTCPHIFNLLIIMNVVYAEHFRDIVGDIHQMLAGTHCHIIGIVQC